MFETTLEKDDTMSRVSVRKISYLVIKRIFDILISIIGLILLIPIALIIKVAYMCTGDFTSIFFVQERIGKNGKLFKFFKFRSMVPNADEVLFRTMELDEIIAAEYNKNKKLKNDPRVTKIGRVIRKLSIDELPQFINVFLGDMSLIGNRPYLPREQKDMGQYYESVIASRPGITGMWQTHGRSEVTFEQRLVYDDYYYRNWSLWMDMTILMKTFRTVNESTGAV